MQQQQQQHAAHVQQALLFLHDVLHDFFHHLLHIMMLVPSGRWRRRPARKPNRRDRCRARAVLALSWRRSNLCGDRAVADSADSRDPPPLATTQTTLTSPDPTRHRPELVGYTRRGHTYRRAAAAAASLSQPAARGAGRRCSGSGGRRGVRLRWSVLSAPAQANISPAARRPSERSGGGEAARRHMTKDSRS